MGRSSADLARSLFSGPNVHEVMPFWADGGRPAHLPHTGCIPGRHRMAAEPSRVARAHVESLTEGALVAWLRENIPAPGEGLTVVGLSYDAGRALETLPTKAVNDLELPDVVVATYPAYLAAPSDGGPWTLWARDTPSAEALLTRLTRTAFVPDGVLPRGLTGETDLEDYHADLAKVLAGIQRGDFYQANIARRLEAPMQPEMTPWLYLKMRSQNPAAFGVLWAVDGRSWIASSSPECLLQWDPTTREARSYPIKGTRRRSDCPTEDAHLRRELVEDPKERAEHVMIVDLVRNDLGRVAEVGTVVVGRLLEIQALPTVHHLVSEVRATIRPTCDLPEILGALFPGGSITGAPKIAAMRKIEEVERVRRSYYTGSVGLIEPDGKATFNILIRTCIAANSRLYYYTGGGIVADSTPAREWEETAEKAAALIRTLRT